MSTRSSRSAGNTLVEVTLFDTTLSPLSEGENEVPRRALIVVATVAGGLALLDLLLSQVSRSIRPDSGHSCCDSGMEVRADVQPMLQDATAVQSRASMLEATFPASMELLQAFACLCVFGHDQVEVQDKKHIIDSLKRALHESQDLLAFFFAHAESRRHAGNVRNVRRRRCKPRSET